MKLVILAGGKGTRLGFKEIPKPLVKVAGKPILERQIDLAIRYAIKDIYFLSGYLSDHIIEYLGDGSRYGINIRHYVDEKPLGTSGALKVLEGEINERFLVFYGDLIMNMSIDSFIKFDKHYESIATILVHPNDHPYDSDLVETDKNNRVLRFYSKPHQEGAFYPNLVNAAVYILSPKIFRYIEKDKKSDFGKDLFPTILKRGEDIYAYNTPEYIKDMGTPDRLSKVEQDIRKGVVSRKNIENQQKAIFIDRDGVLVHDDGFVNSPDQLDLMPGVAEAIGLVNKSDYLSVVVTNQPGIAKGFFAEKDLKKIHNKLEYLLGKEKAYLDRIYYCPHHPEKGFEGEVVELKRDCDCRKPKIGMIERAQKELNISLGESFIIGDSFRDVLCGRNAGISTVAVRTGNGLRENYVHPDYFFEDLREAICFLIQEPYLDRYNEVMSIFLANRTIGNPFLVCVDGAAKSGKTTLANYLAKKSRRDGLKVAIISLDKWTRSHDHENNVYNQDNRDRIIYMNKWFRSAIDSELEQRGIYEHADLKGKQDGGPLRFLDQDMVIVEGIFAFDLKDGESWRGTKVFCDINESVLHERLKNYCIWKGIDKDKADEIIYRRKIERAVLIEQNRDRSNIVVN